MARFVSFKRHKQRRAGQRRPVNGPRRPRHRFALGRWFGRSYGLLALAAVLALGLKGQDVSTSQIVGLWQPPPAAAAITSRPFPICSSGARVDCIVDGDTFWFSGQKVRIADINTPEISSPACRRERELGEKAKRRLHQLINAGPIELRKQGRDRDQYGRLLRTVHRNGHSLGDILVAEGLAHRWKGRKESWCG
jgi:micrococcal nuclease